MAKKPLYGVDFSHWQTESDCYSHFPSADFVILKITEGETMTDRKFNKYYEIAKSCGVKLFGAYHFYNSLKSPEQNAKNYLNAIKKYLGNDNMLLAVDIEGKHAQKAGIWDNILAWCNIVEEETGIKPLVYTNADNVQYMQKLFDNDNGLWVAHYTNKSAPRTYMYGNMWAIWQFTDRPLDLDIFNGNENQFKKYCKSNKKVVD